MPRVNAFMTLAAYAALVACGPINPRAEVIAGLHGDPAAGALLFQSSCATCHQAAGFQKMTDWFPEKALLSTVIDGVPRTRMPSFAAFSDQQIADINAYLHEKPQ